MDFGEKMYYTGGMDNSLLRKYVMKDKNDADFLHSSAYARAQSGGAMGATGTRGFQQRQNAERKIVGGYGDSKIGTSMNMSVRPKTYSGENKMRMPGARPSLPPKR